MLFIYRILASLAAPLALLRLRRKARGMEEVAVRWREWLGKFDNQAPAGVWIHAASVGEVNAMAPLIEKLAGRFPDRQVLVSTLTPTGSAEARRRFGDRVCHRLAPLDTRRAVCQWLDTVQPDIALIAETEIWPELFEQLGRRGIPLVIVNGRISPGALGRYRHLRPLMTRALSHTTRIACQSRAEAERFVHLGAPPERIHVTGNVKFDGQLPPDLEEKSQVLRGRWGQRPVWVAGSTHGMEEDQLIAAHRKLLKKQPAALLVLAPRHPERAGEIRRRLAGGNLKVIGLEASAGPEHSVVVIDRIGWLQPAYQAAGVCFVGGSLVPVGGHNLLEPARLSRPVLAGPYLHEQASMAELLREDSALLEVTDADELADALIELFDDPARQLKLGMAAARAARQGRGAVEQTLVLIDQVLAETPPDRVTPAGR